MKVQQSEVKTSLGTRAILNRLRDESLLLAVVIYMSVVLLKLSSKKTGQN
jgi:hypothetical protein